MTVKEYTTPCDQAYEFYKRFLVTTSSSAYEVLLGALKETRQVVPFKILNDEVVNREPTPPPFHKLQFGSPERCQEMLVYMIETGQSKTLQAKDEKKASLLHASVLYIDVMEETIQLFQQLGVGINDLDGSGKNVLMYAIEGRRSCEYLSMLIRLGANWKAVDFDGNTALHVAAQIYSGKHLVYLMDLGVDAEAKNKDDMSALCLAIRGIKPDCRENIEAIKRLVMSRASNMQMDRENMRVIAGRMAASLREHQNGW